MVRVSQGGCVGACRGDRSDLRRLEELLQWQSIAAVFLVVQDLPELRTVPHTL